MRTSPFSAETIKLTCEICGRKYTDHYDPKMITEDNKIPVLFYCCSLKCERESWKRIKKTR